MIFSYVLLMSHVWEACKHRNEPAYGADFRSWHGQRLIKQLMSNYDRNVRPRGIDGNSEAPTIVVTSLMIKSISSVKEQNMEFKTQFRFKQEWFDDRLKFRDWYYKSDEYIHMGRDYQERIWLPDTFFQNEKEASRHMIDKENYYIKFRSDGKIIYDRRLSMTFSCIMDLSKYPMDSQTCLMDFASYAYTTNDIIYEWPNQDPLQFKKGATSGLPNFIIVGSKNGSCSSVTNTGSYSCLRVELQLQRVFSFFLLQLYVPSSMLVAVSWVSYWIDWRATAGRVPLAIITLLTMITQSHVINAALPPVSYTKAIDVWIGACVAFIFCSLIEYAIVNYTGIKEQRRKASGPIHVGLPLQSYKRQSANYGTFEWFFSSLFSPSTSNKPKQRSRSQRKVAGMDTREPSGQLLSSEPTLRKRSHIRSIHRNYSIEITEVLSSAADVQQNQSNLSVETGLSEMTVYFEDISNNFDWIRRREAKCRLRVNPLCARFRKHGRAERIDIVSRTVFPIAFMLFNVVYWITYW